MLRTSCLLFASAAACLWSATARPQTPWGGDDTGFLLPPKSAAAKCEAGAAKAEGKLAQCIIKCHMHRVPIAACRLTVTQRRQRELTRAARLTALERSRAASRAAKARWVTPRWAVREARRQIGEVLRRVRRVPVRPLIPATPPPQAASVDAAEAVRVMQE